MENEYHVPMYEAPPEPPKNYPQKFVYPCKDTLPKDPPKSY